MEVRFLPLTAEGMFVVDAGHKVIFIKMTHFHYLSLGMQVKLLK